MKCYYIFQSKMAGTGIAVIAGGVGGRATSL